MSEEYVDPNSGRVAQPGAAYPGMNAGGVPSDAAASASEEEQGTQQQDPEQSVVPVEVPEPDAGPLDALQGDGGQDGETGDFNPADHTVQEVKDYVAANPNQRESVLQAEKDGENRVTLVSALEADGTGDAASDEADE